MKSVLTDLDSGVAYLFEILGDLYNVIHKYQLITLMFFLPFAVYLFILILEFFMDVSQIHYDKSYTYVWNNYKKFHYDFKKSKPPNIDEYYDPIKTRKSEIADFKSNAQLLKDEHIKRVSESLEGLPMEYRVPVANAIFNAQVKHYKNNSIRPNSEVNKSQSSVSYSPLDIEYEEE